MTNETNTSFNSSTHSAYPCQHCAFDYAVHVTKFDTLIGELKKVEGDAQRYKDQVEKIKRENRAHLTENSQSKALTSYYGQAADYILQDELGLARATMETAMVLARVIHSDSSNQINTAIAASDQIRSDMGLLDVVHCGIGCECLRPYKSKLEQQERTTFESSSRAGTARPTGMLTPAPLCLTPAPKLLKADPQSTPAAPCCSRTTSGTSIASSFSNVSSACAPCCSRTTSGTSTASFSSSTTCITCSIPALPVAQQQQIHVHADLSEDDDLQRALRLSTVQTFATPAAAAREEKELQAALRQSQEEAELARAMRLSLEQEEVYTLSDHELEEQMVTAKRLSMEQTKTEEDFFLRFQDMAFSESDCDSFSGYSSP